MLQRQLSRIPQQITTTSSLLTYIEHFLTIWHQSKRNHHKWQSFKRHQNLNIRLCPYEVIKRTKCYHQLWCPARYGYLKCVSCLELLTCYPLSLLKILWKGKLIFGQTVERGHQKFSQEMYWKELTGISACIQELVYCCLLHGDCRSRKEWSHLSGWCNVIVDIWFEKIHALDQLLYHEGAYPYYDLNLGIFVRSGKVIGSRFIVRHEEHEKKSKSKKASINFYFLYPSQEIDFHTSWHKQGVFQPFCQYMSAGFDPKSEAPSMLDKDYSIAKLLVTGHEDVLSIKSSMKNQSHDIEKFLSYLAYLIEFG